jgi:putative tryptophan/tyrosine transport system substrate-binding protein
MRRREFITLLGGTAAGGLATSAAPAWAQVPRLPKIGWLKIQDKNHTPGQLKAFLDGLRALGQIEGQSFEIEARFADGNRARLPKLAEGLVQAGVSVILATSQPSIEAGWRVTQSVPIVGRMNDDPVLTGFAKSLARPGGNFTGVYSLLEAMTGKRLELLRQAVPSLRRVGALLTLDHGDTRRWLVETEKAAQQLALEIQVMDVRAANDLGGVFAQAAAHGINGLLSFRNPIIVTNYQRVVELCSQYRLPGIFDAREFVDVGGFMSYGPNLDDIYRLLASHVDQILKGAKPGAIPIEQPTKFELVINLKTAKALSITVPPSLLTSADGVIE